MFNESDESGEEKRKYVTPVSLTFRYMANGKNGRIKFYVVFSLALKSVKM